MAIGSVPFGTVWIRLNLVGAGQPNGSLRRNLAVGARTSEGRLSTSIAVNALEPVTGPCGVETDGKLPRAEASKVSAPKVRRVQRYLSGIFQPGPYSQLCSR
jgi:hypothetical protein